MSPGSHVIILAMGEFLLFLSASQEANIWQVTVYLSPVWISTESTVCAPRDHCAGVGQSSAQRRQQAWPHASPMLIYFSHDCYSKQQNLEGSDNHQQLCLQKQPGHLLYYTFSEDVCFKGLEWFNLTQGDDAPPRNHRLSLKNISARCKSFNLLIKGIPERSINKTRYCHCSWLPNRTQE